MTTTRAESTAKPPPGGFQKRQNRNGSGVVQTRVPPHDLAAEQAMLGAALLNPRAAAVLVELEPEAFYKPAHGHICATIQELVRDGQPADIILVAELLRDHQLLESIGGPSALTGLQNDCPASSNANHYADTIRALCRRRQLIGLAGELAEAAYVGADTNAALLLLEHHQATGGHRLQQLRAQLLGPLDLDRLAPPEPLIDDLLMRDTLAALYGRPGGGKSFVATDIALSIATGTWWHGRSLRQGVVLYIAAEGSAGLADRKKAWERDRNVIATGFPIHWLPAAINLLDAGWAAPLVQLVAEMHPALIVIDTLARSMSGGDENAAKDMGLVIENADRLKRASGACVLLVHHTPKSGETLRGHSSLEGAVDTAIEVKADGELVTLTCEKQKDAAKFNPITLCIRQVAESAVLVPFGRGTHGLGSGSEKELLGTLWDSFGTTGATPTELKEASGLPRTSYYRALNHLLRRGLVHNVGTETRPRYRPVVETESHESHESPISPGPSPTHPPSLGGGTWDSGTIGTREPDSDAETEEELF